MWLFQPEGLGELALRENDFQLIDYLWRHWSYQEVDEEHLQRVKATFRQPGVAEAALSYYRGLLSTPATKPEFFRHVTASTHVPMMVVYGAEDPARVISQDEKRFFDGPYRRELVAGAGHFVHREQPEPLTNLILDWLNQHRWHVEQSTC